MFDSLINFCTCTGITDVKKISNNRKLHSLLVSKIPLEKSVSVPDMLPEKKKNDRLIA